MASNGERAGIGIVAVGALAFVSHQAGVWGHFFAESGGLRGLGRSISALDHSGGTLHEAIENARSKGTAEGILTDALCTAATDAVNEQPTDVPSFVETELAQQVTGYPSLEGKLEEFETGLKLSQWNSGTARVYWRACVFRL
jgi:hypothetical protein